jgi:hypothetical protein
MDASPSYYLRVRPTRGRASSRKSCCQILCFDTIEFDDCTMRSWTLPHAEISPRSTTRGKVW